MSIESLFRADCMQQKPFDIRRERRQYRKYCKTYHISHKEIRHFRTIRKHYKLMTADMDQSYCIDEGCLHHGTEHICV